MIGEKGSDMILEFWENSTFQAYTTNREDEYDRCILPYLFCHK